MIVIMVLLGIFIILTSLSSVSAASTVYVNATGGNDSNNGSIDYPYQTIGKGINASAENGTVQIADGTYSGDGNTNIIIRKNITITGQSQSKTIINGTGTNGIFGVIGNVTVTIQNLTFTNGTKGWGGAIYHYEGALTVKNCTFTGNNGYKGGAIYNENGTITLIDCTFTNNNATIGSAIMNGDTINLSSCTFTGNKAAYYGGAIYNCGILNVSSCTFTGNTASESGGAIWNNYDGVVVHFNRFLNNTESSGNTIYCSNGSVDAMYNWWGSNSDPSSQVSGNVSVSPWLVLSISADPSEIFNTKTSNVTVDLYKDSDNGDHSSESSNYPSEIPLKFTTAWGSITQTTLSYGTGSAIFTANSGAVPQQNSATVSVADILNQTAIVSTNITIKPISNLYINTTTSNQNPNTGDTFILTYKLGNKGPDVAQDVTIIFQLPEGLDFVNIHVDNGNCTYNETTRTVTWTLDSVPVGDPYLYLTVKAVGDGTYKIIPNTTSATYNLNSGGSGIITINVQPKNNNNSSNGSSRDIVNAASKTTIGLQKTGLPLNYLILAILMVLGGLVPKRK